MHLSELATAKSPIADVVVSSLVFQCFCRLLVFSRFVFQAASAEAPTRRDGRGPFIFAWCSADISHQFLSLSAIPFCLLTRLSTLLTLHCIFCFHQSMSRACSPQKIRRVRFCGARVSVFPFHHSSCEKARTAKSLLLRSFSLVISFYFKVLACCVGSIVLRRNRCVTRTGF